MGKLLLFPEHISSSLKWREHPPLWFSGGLSGTKEAPACDRPAINRSYSELLDRMEFGRGGARPLNSAEMKQGVWGGQVGVCACACTSVRGWAVCPWHSGLRYTEVEWGTQPQHTLQHLRPGRSPCSFQHPLGIGPRSRNTSIWQEAEKQGLQTLEHCQ